MTEKRFMVDDAGTLIDMETRNMYELAYEVVDLLNEQHETIQQLKQENMELKLTCKPLFSKRQLHKENQQLKTENQHIKTTIREAYNNERTELGKSVLKQLLETI